MFLLFSGIMAFERFNKKSRGEVFDFDEPMVSFRPSSGSMGFLKSSVSLLPDSEYFVFLVDEENMELALEPCSESDEDAYKLTGVSSGTCSISVKQVMREFGISITDLDEVTYCPVKEEDGRIIVDVSEIQAE
jgi:hypothetical protein